MPLDNPVTPRRVRPSCPKNSFAETSELAKLSVTQHEGSLPVNTDDGASWASNYGREDETRSATNHQLQEGLNKKEIISHDAEPQYEASLLLEKQEIEQALTRQTSFVKADETSTNEIRLTIPKVKFENVKAAMKNSRDLVYLIFEKSGIL